MICSYCGQGFEEDDLPLHKFPDILSKKLYTCQGSDAYKTREQRVRSLARYGNPSCRDYWKKELLNLSTGGDAP